MQVRILLLFLSGVVFTTQSTAAAVDDLIVKQWIAASLSTAPLDTADGIEAIISVQHTIDTEREGWRRLKRCRDAGNSLDLSLAAAEHYLFMRFSANSAGDAGYRRLPQWYEDFKRFAVRADLEKYIQTSTQPVSPPNPEVTRWGNSGVDRGLKEYEDREKKPPTDYGISIAALAGTAYATYYYKYLPSPATSCDIRIPPSGTWDSTDPGKRWTLELNGTKCIWTERTSTGVSIVRKVTMQLGGDGQRFKALRENDADTLSALGFSPAIRAAVLARSPQPSYMLITIGSDKFFADWNGLLVIKDDKANFKELKQPGQVPPKRYDFTRRIP